MRRTLLTAFVLLSIIALGPPLAARLAGWGPDPGALPERQRSVELADGRLVHFHELGDPGGTPVVLVHGLPGNAADWAGLPAALAARGPYRVIAYDRIGFGYSTRQAAGEDAYTYASNARELAALLDALAIEQAVLVGWSYGGAVVQTFAVEHPERASHVVLVASVGPASADAPQDDALSTILGSALAEPILLWIGSIPPLSKAFTRSALVQAFAREHDIPPGWLEYTRAELALPGTRHAFVAEARHDDPSALQPSRIQAPTLVIQGADDYLVSYAVGEDLQRRIPESRLEPVLSGSHMLPVTHADELADAIHEHVRAY